MAADITLIRTGLASWCVKSVLNIWSSDGGRMSASGGIIVIGYAPVFGLARDCAYHC